MGVVRSTFFFCLGTFSPILVVVSIGLSEEDDEIVSMII